MNKTPHLFGDKDYWVFDASPATGIIYIVNNFLSGHVRLRGKKHGGYPYKYLETIDGLFGKAHMTIEVCSGNIRADNNTETVDINIGKDDETPSVVCDGQNLSNIRDEYFDRWRCDPPYNAATAKKMYNCEMPSLYKLLEEGARVVIPGALMFLLCSQNHQRCPPGVERIGLILITIVPNNEIRACNIYRKIEK